MHMGSTTTERTIDTGVFLPVGNGGWIISTTTPDVPATYGYNREVTRLAEELGFDFALSMAKWRGYGGPSQHWDYTIESLSTMGALAEATERIKLWGTVHTMVWHPAVVAKMVATLDQVSGGRVGLNLVSGSNPFDQGQMGLWKDIGHAERYALAEEWITVAKRLWSEDRVDHSGTHFTLEDCVSRPKPSAMPTIISAGTSDTGLEFAIRNCDVCFVSGSDEQTLRQMGERVRRISAEVGKEAKIYALFMVIPGATDEEARERVMRYDAGVDVEAIERQAYEYSTDVKENSMRTKNLQRLEDPRAVSRSAVVGSPESIAEQLATLIHAAPLDGVTLTFPDFIGDLRTFGEEVVPRLRDHGIVTGAEKLKVAQ